MKIQNKQSWLQIVIRLLVRAEKLLLVPKYDSLLKKESILFIKGG